jgi:predicted ribosomally synthesized peptide with SipW-like signal peptide
MTIPATPPTHERSHRRRLKAILAGGLVLGVGAAVTLAVWNDSDFATGTFTSGHFTVQSSEDGTTFADHATSQTAAPLAFTTGFDNISRSMTVAAPFVFRLDEDTTYDATVAVASAQGSGTAESALSYGIVRVASVLACTPAAAGSATIVPPGTALDAVDNATTFELAKSTVLHTDPGAEVVLCIQVTSSASLAQGTTADATWGFLATSHG